MTILFASGCAAQVSSIVSLAPGKSAIIDSPVNVTRVSVAAENVVDAVPVTPREVLLIGKNTGETTLILWRQDGTRVAYDVNVGRANEPRLLNGDLVRYGVLAMIAGALLLLAIWTAVLLRSRSTWAPAARAVTHIPLDPELESPARLSPRALHLLPAGVRTRVVDAELRRIAEIRENLVQKHAK